MSKPIIKPLLAALVLSGLSAVASASTPPPYPGYSESIFNHSCSNGKFIGYVQGALGFKGDRMQYVRLHKYRIVDNHNTNSRNKANINLKTTRMSDGGIDTAKSPDSMKQDGQWHALNLGTWPGTFASSEIEFIFDKKGSDPKCKVRF